MNVSENMKGGLMQYDTLFFIVICYFMFFEFLQTYSRGKGKLFLKLSKKKKNHL